MTTRLLEGLRGRRYGEVLLAFGGAQPRVEVYNSFPLNDCPEQLWRRLDPIMIARDHDASLAFLNGPRYWMMDAIGKVAASNGTVEDFGGIAMRQVATIELDGPLATQYYQEHRVNRGAAFIFDVGRSVYELRSDAGRTYVLQAYCVSVDPELNESSLDSLGERLDLPDGWTYGSRVLDEELVLDTTLSPGTVLQDEFQNTYSLIA